MEYSQELRITAEAKLSVAAAMREEIKCKWEIIHEFEKEARSLIKIAQMEDGLV